MSRGISLGIKITRILIVLILLFAIGETFVTYAVVPNEYGNETYTKKEVRVIVLKEKGEGVKYAYSQNTSNLVGVYIPLLALFLVHVSLIGFQSKNGEE